MLDSIASLAPASSFDLVFSVYCTQVRSGGALRQRHSRFEVMLYSLRSYAALPIERVYLYILLAPEFAARRDELERRAHALFGARLVTMRLPNNAQQLGSVRRACTIEDTRNNCAYVFKYPDKMNLLIYEISWEPKRLFKSLVRW